MCLPALPLPPVKKMRMGRSNHRGRAWLTPGVSPRAAVISADRSSRGDAALLAADSGLVVAMLDERRRRPWCVVHLVLLPDNAPGGQSHIANEFEITSPMVFSSE